MVLTRSLGLFIALAAMMLSIAGCPDRPIDPPVVEDDHTVTCQAFCATVHACGIDPVSATEAECIEDCRKPGEGVWRGQSCDDLADTMLTCVANLDCEQYAQHEADLNSSACYQETWNYSVCLSEEMG